MHAKYEFSIFDSSKVIIVKVKLTTGQKQYEPNLSMWGYKTFFTIPLWYGIFCLVSPK